jgi:hypothetical protein
LHTPAQPPATKGVRDYHCQRSQTGLADRPHRLAGHGAPHKRPTQPHLLRHERLHDIVRLFGHRTLTPHVLRQASRNTYRRSCSECALPVFSLNATMTASMSATAYHRDVMNKSPDLRSRL